MSGSQKRRRNSHFCHGQLSSRQTTLSTETTTPTATVASATTKSSYNLIYGINICRSNLVRQTNKKKRATKCGVNAMQHWNGYWWQFCCTLSHSIWKVAHLWRFRPHFTAAALRKGQTGHRMSNKNKKQRVIRNTRRSKINCYSKMVWGSKKGTANNNCPVGPKPVRRLSFQRFVALYDSFYASCEIYRRSTTSAPITARQWSWSGMHSFVASLGNEIAIKFTISSMPE